MNPESEKCVRIVTLGKNLTFGVCNTTAMLEEYSHKAMAVCLGVVALLSVAFASTDEQITAAKVEIPIEPAKVEAIKPVRAEPVVEAATVEAIDAPPVISTSTGVYNARWSANVTVTQGAREFRFESNGLPDHELPSQFVMQQRGYAPPAGSQVNALDTIAPLVELPIEQTIPLNPVLAEEPTTAPAGRIGVLVNGTQVYNDSELVATTVMASLEYGFVDVCNGHPNVLEERGEGVGGYHYHAVPSCTTDSIDIEGQHSSIVGFMIDGFPIYGSNDEGGAAIQPSQLDSCNGHVGPTPEFPDGIYHYHFLDDVSADPFPCLSGEFDDVATDVVEPAAVPIRIGE